MHRRSFLLASVGVILFGNTSFEDRVPVGVNRFGDVFWAWQEGDPKERRHFLPPDLYKCLGGGDADAELQYRYYSSRLEAMEGLAFGRRMVEMQRRRG